MCITVTAATAARAIAGKVASKVRRFFRLFPCPHPMANQDKPIQGNELSDGLWRTIKVHGTVPRRLLTAATLLVELIPTPAARGFMALTSPRKPRIRVYAEARRTFIQAPSDQVQAVREHLQSHGVD